MQTKDSSLSDALSISHAQAKFSHNLNAWQKVQLQHHPKLHDYVPLVDSAKPEEALQLFPSAFTAKLCEHLRLTQLATIEYECEGQAHDALQALHQMIQVFNYNLLDKKNNVHGIVATLQSESFLHTFTLDK